MLIDSSKRGAVRRPLLLLIPALLALLVGLYVISSGSEEATETEVEVLAPSAGGGELDIAHLEIAETDGFEALNANRGVGALTEGSAYVRLRGKGALTGVVVEEGTEIGAPGVRVELLATPPSGGVFIGRILKLASFEEDVATRTKPVAVQFSDNLGNFSFEGVRSGKYFIDAFGPASTATRPIQVGVLESGSGGPVTIEVRPAGAITGNIVSVDGAPALGVTVVLSPGPGHFLKQLREGTMRLVEVDVDENGTFRFEGVAPGEGYELSAASDEHTITHAVGVEVLAGEETIVNMQMRVGGRIAGQILSVVADDAEEGRDPVPLAGAQIGAVPRGLRDIRMLEEIIKRTHAVTDEEGRYVIEGVPEGDVDILAIAPGHLPGQGVPLIAVEGVLVQASEIRLKEGPMATGRVVDSSGRAVPGVQVRWRMVDFRNMEFDFSLAPMVSQAVEGWEYPVTDEDGRFIAGPCAGEAPHTLRFMKSGYAAQEAEWDPEEQEGDLEIILLGGGVVEGIVMDLEEAEPVTEFMVAGIDRVMSAPGEPGRFNPFSGGEVFEDPAGRFRLEGVEPGDVTLSFKAEGYLMEIVEDIVVVEGEPTRGVIVRMQPGGIVRGIVTDGEGLPVRGAQVVAVSSRDRDAGRQRRREGRTGRRRGGESAPSEDEAETQRPERGDREARFMMGGGQGAAMMPPAIFSYAAGMGMFTENSAITDEQGAFEVSGLQPGKVRLYALHSDYAGGATEEELELVAGAPIEGVMLELLKGGGAYGSVEDGYGRPLPGTVVFALAPNRMAPGSGGNIPGGLYEAGTDQNGEYKMENMAPGSYVFVVTRGDDQLNFMSFLSNLNFDLVTIPKGRSIRYDIVDDNASGCRVHGIVYDAGEPVRRGAVTALSFESDNILGVDFKVARIRSDGSYEFPGLKSGEYVLQVQGVGRQIRMDLDVPEQPELQKDLHLPEGGVEGEVVAKDSGDPVQGATVFLRPLEQPDFSGMLGSLIASQGVSEEDRTDSDGKFSFERVSPGEYELLVRVGRRGGEEGVLLAAAEPMIIEIYDGRIERGLKIELPTALAIKGTVVDSTGVPIASASIAGAKSGTMDPRPVRTKSAADGSFTLTPVGVGSYTISCTADDHSPARGLEVEVKEGGGELKIVLQVGVEVRLLVMGSDGAPVRGARGKLTLVNGGGGAVTDVGGAFGSLFSGDGATGEDGRSVLGRYSPGTYSLEVWRGFQRATLPEIILEEGALVEDISINLP
jgi:protocatechuate 3,4-dioxygenase beta subunit